MAKDLNKVLLIGRLGQDPELKYTQSGVAVANFSLATGMKWKDQEGNWQERTEWHNVKAWRGLAETCSNYLKKGSRVYVEGRLETSNWEDENKKKHYKTEVIIDDMIMLDSKSDNTGGGSNTAKTEKSSTESKASDDDLPF
ncbi:MAG: single-stranded DNA-binding protein [Chlorobi bacterium]|nr:single-stranded DNA-binding protein [Chlorobiota bacterium]MCI0715837.1 single-stranded DNA-binding protein [Chlorobiota bacterium]